MDMYVPVAALRTLPVVKTMVTPFYADFGNRPHVFFYLQDG
jgi:hypothetical protein